MTHDPRTWVRRQLAKTYALAVPMALGQLGQQLLATTDSAMVGHHEPLQLAGFGLANTVLLSAVFVGVGVLMGLDGAQAQAFGRRDLQCAHRLLRTGLRLSMWLTVPIVAFGLSAPHLFDALGVAPTVAGDAAVVIWGRLPSIYPYLVYTACVSYLQAKGRTRPIVVSVVLGNAVNLVSDYALVGGVPQLGLPAMGAFGASVSTCIVCVAMAAYLFVACRLPPSRARPAPAMMRRTIAVGWPIGGQLLAEFGIFVVVGIFAARLGAVAASAHQLAFTIITISYSFALGAGAASTVRVGRAAGSQRWHEIRPRTAVTLLAAAPVGLVAGIAMLAVPGPALSLFTSDATVIDAAVPLLRLAALVQLADFAQSILGGALRGVQRTGPILLAHCIGHYGIGLPIAWWLAFHGGGAPGLWIGLFAGLVGVVAVLAVALGRVLRGHVGGAS
ncbi:MAG: MATE family efflux transporter [Myxococcota bacterium]